MFVPIVGRRGAVACAGTYWRQLECTRSLSAAQPAAATVQKAKSGTKPVTTSSSFVQNVFRGIVEPEQAFPYPEVLSADQLETLQMLVPPVEKFLTEVNDPAKNDIQEKVPEEVMQVCPCAWYSSICGMMGLPIAARHISGHERDGCVRSAGARRTGRCGTHQHAVREAYRDLGS